MPPKTRIVNLQPPLGGLFKSYAVQKMPPFTSPSMRNYRARGTQENRLRGGSRPGLGKEFSEQVSAASNPIRLTTTYSLLAGGPRTLVTRVVASANGEFWLENASTQLVKVTLPTTATYPASLGSSELIQAVQDGTKLYIADAARGAYSGTDGIYTLDDAGAYNHAMPGTVTGVKDNGTSTITATESVFVSGDATKTLMIDGVGNFTIASFTSATVVVVTGDASAASADNFCIQTARFFTSATVTDWTAGDCDLSVHLLAYTTAMWTGYTYLTIATIFPKLIRFGHATSGTDVQTTSCIFHLQRQLLEYDGTDLNLVTASAGTVPRGCPLIALYNDRLVLGGDPLTPHAWNMSRQQDPTDWDTSQTDVQAAVAGTTSTTGEPGEPLTALIPSSNDYLVFGCTNSLYRLVGDPMARGKLNLITRKAGVLYRGAWCHGPAGEIYFLSQNGLHMLPPGAAGVPEPLSRQKLPEELLNVDTSTYQVSMVYDPVELGVLIYLTEIATGGQDHWFFSIENKGFCPDRYPAAQEPFSVHYLESHDPTKSKVLLGCRDGYVRSYSDDNVNDDGTEIESYVVYGPLRPGGNDYISGILKSLVATISKDTTKKVTWHVYAAKTAEEVIDSITDVVGTVTGQGVYDSATGKTTITATSVFTSLMQGRRFTFDTSGTEYRICDYTDATHVVVWGDASAETADDTFVISGHFKTGTWDANRNYTARPRAGGGAVALKVGYTSGANYSPWSIENIIAEFRKRGRQRLL